MCPCNHKPCTCCACNEPASEPTRQPHKHAALIKVWADGAKIELKSCQGRWLATELPSWDVDREYRIKPVPKPDVVLYGNIRETAGFMNPDTSVPLCGRFSIEKTKTDNMRAIYDGETGKLKSVSILD